VFAPPERQVRLEIDVTNATVEYPQRWWVTGVDNLRPSGSQVDTSQLSGDVLAAVEVLCKPDAGTSRLLGKLQTGASAIAKRAD
jgi:hypothetical protein